MTIFDKYIYCITLMRTNKSETCVFDFKHVSVIRKENTFVKNSIVSLDFFQEKIMKKNELARVGFEPTRTYVHWILSPTP